MTIFILACALIVNVVLSLRPGSSPQLRKASRRQPDLSVKWHVGPTLRELRANFAVLRRPATAREQAAVAMFTAATSDQPEVPEYVRIVGRIQGAPVYVVVYPLFRHGARGAVVAHMMSVDVDDGGYSYRAGNYAIFPQTVGGFNGQPITYFGLVPDGVRSVRWQFACITGAHSSLAGCRLPSPRIADIAVHHNLAALRTTTPYQLGANGRTYVGVTKVTWYGPAGMSKVFTNANSAVPIPGAPAWTR